MPSRKSTKTSPSVWQSPVPLPKIELGRPSWLTVKNTLTAIVAIVLVSAAGWLGYATFFRSVADTCPGTFTVNATNTTRYDGDLATFEFPNDTAVSWRSLRILDTSLSDTTCQLSTLTPRLADQWWARYVPPIFGWDMAIYYYPNYDVQEPELGFAVTVYDGQAMTATDYSQDYIEGMKQQIKNNAINRQRGRQVEADPIYGRDIVTLGDNEDVIKLSYDRPSQSSQAYSHDMYLIERDGQLKYIVRYTGQASNQAELDQLLIQGQPSLERMLQTIEFK